MADNAFLLGCGTAGDAVFPDLGPAPATSFAGVGNVAWEVAPAGSLTGASMNFDGTGDYLQHTPADNTQFLIPAFNEGALTLKARIYIPVHAATNRVLIHAPSDGLYYFELSVNASNKLQLSYLGDGGGQKESSTSIPAGTWVEIAVCYYNRTGAFTDCAFAINSTVEAGVWLQQEFGPSFANFNMVVDVLRIGGNGTDSEFSGDIEFIEWTRTESFTSGTFTNDWSEVCAEGEFEPTNPEYGFWQNYVRTQESATFFSACTTTPAGEAYEDGVAAAQAILDGGFTQGDTEFDDVYDANDPLNGDPHTPYSVGVFFRLDESLGGSSIYGVDVLNRPPEDAARSIGAALGAEDGDEAHPYGSDDPTFYRPMTPDGSPFVRFFNVAYLGSFEGLYAANTDLDNADPEGTSGTAVNNPYTGSDATEFENFFFAAYDSVW
jgi:hypothetical protein